jgi:hypothetical protein
LADQASENQALAKLAAVANQELADIAPSANAALFKG